MYFSPYLFIYLFIPHQDLLSKDFNLFSSFQLPESLHSCINFSVSLNFLDKYFLCLQDNIHQGFESFLTTNGHLILSSYNISFPTLENKLNLNHSNCKYFESCRNYLYLDRYLDNILHNLIRFFLLKNF